MSIVGFPMNYRIHDHTSVHSHSMIDVLVLYKLTLFISSILFVVDQLHVDVTLMSLVRLQKLDVIIVL